MPQTIETATQDSSRRESGLVAMKIFPTEYDGVPEKVKLLISNNSENEIEFGEVFSLERLTVQDWLPVPFPDDAVFHLILHFLLPKEEREFDLYLYPKAIKYDPGKYRIKKEISVGVDKKIFYAEFMIR